MKSQNNPNEFNLSLIQQREQRQLMMEKMRGKLAGPSQTLLLAKERQKYAFRKQVFGWGWRMAILAAFAAGNIYYLSTTPEKATGKAAVKSAPLLPVPAPTLSLNEQALYWTYALYDFDQLKTRFGVPALAIVDAGLARKQLHALLPKVDARTRFIIDRMAPKERKRT